LPALETAHAFAYLDELMPNMNKDQHIVINVSGRGDKDLNSVVEIEDIKL
jgi:tryptophan synthase beta chain